MARAKLIVPAHYVKPQCEAKIAEDTIKYNKRIRRKNPDGCHNLASIKIDGKSLCKKHASIVALDILLNEDS